METHSAHFFVTDDHSQQNIHRHVFDLTADG